MPCDLTRLLAGAADLPAATAPCEPSVGERILRECLRMDEEADRQRRRERAAAFGYYGADLADHTLDALEMTQRAEKLNTLSDPWWQASAFRAPDALERCLDQAQRVTELLQPSRTSLSAFATASLVPNAFSSLLPRYEDLPLSERLSLLSPREHRRPPRPAVAINIHVHPH